MIIPTGSPQNAALGGISISGSSSNDIAWGAYDASMGVSLTGAFTIAVSGDSIAVPAPQRLLTPDIHHEAKGRVMDPPFLVFGVKTRSAVYAMSNRSAFITFVQAATKSFTNFACASS